MKDFNEKNIYHFLALFMEDQIWIKAKRVFFFIFIEDSTITGLIIKLLDMFT